MMSSFCAAAADWAQFVKPHVIYRILSKIADTRGRNFSPLKFYSDTYVYTLSLASVSLLLRVASETKLDCYPVSELASLIENSFVPVR